MRQQLIVTQVFEKRSGTGQKGPWQAQDFAATDTAGNTLRYCIFNKPDLFPMVVSGAVLDAEVVQKARADGQGMNNNVVNFFKGGQPVSESRKSGGFREDPTARRRSMALSYAKDLVVAGKVDVKDLLNKAEALDKWLMGEAKPQTTQKPVRATSQGKVTNEEPPVEEIPFNER